MRPLHRSRPGRRPLHWAAVSAAAVVLLTGCSASEKRGFLPEGVTNDKSTVQDLWLGAWIAALLVGILVWGLTIWCIAVYRKRKTDTEMPVQMRYHMPLEIFYTLVPIMMIGVMFFYTARGEDRMMDVSAKPDTVVNVIGKQWAWDFNYVTQDAYETSVPVILNGPASNDEDLPTLYLPINKRVQFDLTSRDVVHSFWVPAFLRKLDIIPGRVNRFQVVPTVEGTYVGRCAELCGTYHSQMLFQVKVVSQAEFDSHIAELKAKGQAGQLPNSLSREPLVPEDTHLVATSGSN